MSQKEGKQGTEVPNMRQGLCLLSQPDAANFANSNRVASTILDQHVITRRVIYNIVSTLPNWYSITTHHL